MMMGVHSQLKLSIIEKAVNKNTLYSYGMHIIRFKWARKEKMCPLPVLWENTKLGHSPAHTGSCLSVIKDFFDQSCAHLFPGGNSTAKTDPFGVQSSGHGFSPQKGQFQSALWPGLLPSVSAKSVSWEVKAKCEDGGEGIKEPRWEEMGVPPICPYTDSLTPLLYNFNNFKWRNLKPDEHALAE